MSLPLSSAQLGAIKTVATQAPFGKGSDTVVDTAVRDTLQIDADKVTMTNPAWHAALQALVGQVAGRLGISPDHARAELYKILLYEKGGHFKTHQDTEKESGMFGTMVVQFPSQYSGGAIAVRHAGVEREFDMGGKIPRHCTISIMSPSMPTASTRSAKSRTAAGLWRSTRSAGIRPGRRRPLRR